ncbi:uncharacterized protein C14orf93 homolog [Protopterus annectens]|uniref:uncharacterized protein C14orf93 homolog n=1 Tax=Protopterus annectens TaxID=7888 RepID=UPI001CFB750F|nr:uncharacterized protein C14orf93 homolog [Protopterus annectens]
MSFSATILFTPPGGEAKCCTCSCQNQPNVNLNMSGTTPISVCGHGLAVQSTDQLLHLIYQRVEKAITVAESALAVAKSNSEILNKLQEDIGNLKKSKIQEEKELCPKGDPETQNPGKIAVDFCQPVADLPGNIGNAQAVIEELRQLGAATSMSASHMHYPVERSIQRDARIPACHIQPDVMPVHNTVLEDYSENDSPVSQVMSLPFIKQVPATPPILANQVEELDLDMEEEEKEEESMSPNPAVDSIDSTPSSISSRSLVPLTLTRPRGLKNSRRKRDLFLSKLVHSIHNHVSNNKRFNGSESIKSSWNITVVKFLVEKLKLELAKSSHHYTDKELKGACVAYFLTKRREYRNAMNPFRSLKEREEKKLRSRRYRLFANRSAIVRLFPPEKQRLWEGVTEELMSDEEDSLHEPGVWVARSPRFRGKELSELCYYIDANSKHGTKTNRMYGPPSDRLPSADVQVLPPHLYNQDFPLELVAQAQDFSLVSGQQKAFCPDLNSYIKVKVEKDD